MTALFLTTLRIGIYPEGGAPQSAFAIKFSAQSFFYVGCSNALFFQVTLATTLAVVSQTGTSRNQSTHYNVFFQATQVIAFSGNRTLGKNPGGFLERSSRDKRLCCQRCLGDTQQQAIEPCRFFVCCQCLFVLFHNLGNFYLVTGQQRGITRVGDFNLTQHLTNNNFDVFIVDDNTLQTVNVLDFVGDVLRQLNHTQQAQDIVRVGRAIGDHLTLFNRFTFEDVHLPVLRNQNLVRVIVFRSDNQALLALGFLAERDHAADLGENGGLFRATSLEKVSNPRQTTGDVPGLRAFLRNTGNHVTQLHIGAVGHGHQRVRRQEEDRSTTTWQFHFFSGVVDQLNRRTNVLTSGRTLFRIDHFHGRQAGQLICLGANGNTLVHVNELGSTLGFRDDGVRVWIPLGYHNTDLDHIAALHRQHRAVRQFVPLTLTALLIGHSQRGGAGNHNQGAVGLFDGLQVVQANSTAMLDLDIVDRRCPAGRTTNVEGPHGQLGTRLTDRLGSDNANCLTYVDLMAAGQVPAITLRTDTVAGLTGNRRANPDFVHTGTFQRFDGLLVQQGTGRNNCVVLVGRCEGVTGSHTTQNTITQRHYNVTTFDVRRHQQAFRSTTVFLGNYQVLGYVNQTTGQVTGVRGLQCRICQTLTSTVGRDKVLEYVQTFTEVRSDRRFDDGAIRLGHQAPHTGQLSTLCRGTPGTGIIHHVNRVERLLHQVLAVFALNGLAVSTDNLLFGQALHHRLGHFVVGAGPNVDHLVVLLTLGQQTGGVLVLDVFYFVGGRVYQLVLLWRNLEVVETDRDTGPGRVVITGVHQLVSKDDRILQTRIPVTGVDQIGDCLLDHRLVDDFERQAIRNDIKQQCTANGCINQAVGFSTAAVFGNSHFLDPNLDLGLQIDLAGAVGTMGFLDVGKHHAFTHGRMTLTGHVVQTEYHVLRRNDDRLAVGRRQYVVGGHHQRTCFELGFQGQRHVYRHLVTVEVGVIGRTHQRVQLDGLTFNQYRLERLDTQTVQGGRTVQQDRVFTDDFIQDIPDHTFFALDHFLGRFDGGGQAAMLKLGENKRLEQLQCHFLGQTALVQAQVRADHDDRTAGVVNTLTQQVLTETTLLTLDHVSQGLQRTLVGAGDGTAATAVIQQRIDRFLQHTLFVAHDNVRGIQLQQALETVVPVDHPTVQVVQVGGGETATVQRNQRAQIRRQNRQNGHHHVARLVAGVQERLKNFQALAELLDLGFGIGLGDLFAQVVYFLLQVDRFQQLLDGLGTHTGVKFITELFQGFVVLLVVQQLALLQGCHTRVDNNKALEVQNPLDITQGHVQHQTNTGRQRLQEPDVGNRAGQLDVAHALTANAGQCNFNAALFADNTAVLQALVFAAQALVVLDRAEDLGTEKTVTLRFEGTVVNGLRLFYFAKRPGTNHVRRRQSDTDGVEFLALILALEKIQQIFHQLKLRMALISGGHTRCPLTLPKTIRLTRIPARCRYPASGFP